MREHTPASLVAALKAARQALNLGLNLAYAKTSEPEIICSCCHRRWPIIIQENRTAEANVEHDPESICGLMQTRMYAIDAALREAGETV